jgi:hypothetical protein
MKKWEYLLISRLDDEVFFIQNEKVINQKIDFYSHIDKLGAEGWEIVAVEYDNFSPTYVLKRPKE